jgi:hypothetical protein
MNQNGGICNNRDPLSALGGIGDGPGSPDDQCVNFELGPKKKVQIKKFKGTIFIDFREYFVKDDSLLPTKKGVTLSVDSWKRLVTLAPELEKVID